MVYNYAEDYQVWGASYPYDWGLLALCNVVLIHKEECHKPRKDRILEVITPSCEQTIELKIGEYEYLPSLHKNPKFKLDAEVRAIIFTPRQIRNLKFLNLTNLWWDAFPFYRIYHPAHLKALGLGAAYYTVTWEHVFIKKRFEFFKTLQDIFEESYPGLPKGDPKITTIFQLFLSFCLRYEEHQLFTEMIEFWVKNEIPIESKKAKYKGFLTEEIIVFTFRVGKFHPAICFREIL